MIISTFILLASSVTETTIFVNIDLIDLSNTVMLNATNYTVLGRIGMMIIRFIISSDGMNDPIVTVVNGDSNLSISESSSNDTDSTMVMPPNGTATMYDMTVISTIHTDSKADMVEVIVIPDKGMNMTGSYILYII